MANEQPPLSDGRSRLSLFRWAAIPIALVLAVQVIAAGLDAQATSKRAVSPVTSVIDSAGQHALRGNAALAAGDLTTAERESVAALARAPMDAASARILGATLFRTQRAEQGTMMMRIAATLGWRDTPTQLWIIENAIAQNDWAVALQRLDALARREAMLDQTFSIMTVAGINTGGLDALAATLAENPPWRARYFEFANRMDKRLDPGFTAMLSKLKAMGKPAKRGEAAAFVGALFRRGDYRAAHATWHRFVAERAVDAGAISDPGFALAPAIGEDERTPFDWHTYSNAAVSTYLEAPQARVSDPALRVDLSGNAGFGELARIAFLPRGDTVRIAVRATGAPAAAIAPVLRMRIICLPNDAERYFPLTTLARRPDETVFGGAMRLPSTDCVAASLVLSVQVAGASTPVRFTLDEVNVISTGGG